MKAEHQQHLRSQREALRRLRRLRRVAVPTVVVPCDPRCACPACLRRAA